MSRRHHRRWTQAKHGKAYDDIDDEEEEDEESEEEEVEREGLNMAVANLRPSIDSTPKHGMVKESQKSIVILEVDHALEEEEEMAVIQAMHVERGEIDRADNLNSEKNWPARSSAA